ncbi:MAG: TonB-dependent receptor [Spongiibacteraceae bacterium]|jgi:outer membrane receptor protein involved in Fe transport|nr:TonB-dependent receptor [Spongiibacteraceae bacterium]
METTSKSRCDTQPSLYRPIQTTVRKTLPAAILALSPALLMPGTALAQLEEVIVTAQGRQQSLQDVSVSVSVVSGDMLKEQGLMDLQNLAGRVANVKINTGGQVNAIAVRGIGSGENPGFEQAVATFSDGVYRSRSRATRAGLFDIDRIEVLKGPQTTFFGANASAGALNITTRKPSDQFEANLTAMYEFEHSEYNLEAGVSGPLTDNLSARLAVRTHGMDGWVDTPHGDGPEEDAQQARLSFNWRPNESWTSDLRFDYARSRTDTFSPFEIVGCPPGSEFPMSNVCSAILASHPNLDDKLNYKSINPRGTYQDFDFFEVAFTNVWDVGAGSIRSITAYSDMEVQTRAALIPARYAGAVGGYDPFSNEAVEEYEFFSQEVRFESATGGFIEYMVGAYYSKGELTFNNMSSFNFAPFGAIIEGAFGFDFPDFDPGTAMSGRQWSSQDDEMRSVFASVTLNPADFVRVNLGARYTEVEKEGFRRLRGGYAENARMSTFVPFPDTVYPTPNGPLPAISQGEAFCFILNCDTNNYADTKRKDTKFLPSIGVEYDLNADIMLYATYSKGFKAGGFSATSTPSTFGPEEVDAYEIGLKSRLLDNTLELNVAAFYMEYEGLQETTYDANMASEITNVAGSISQGIEVSTTWSPSANFSLMADIGWLDATYEDYPNGECTKAQITANPVCTADLSGVRRAFAAEWSGSVSALWVIPMSDNELRIRPTVNFTSEYYMTATADPILEQSGFAKYDLRIGYGPADKRWEVAMIGRNLTDKETIGYALGMPGANGTIAAMPERGRSIALQFMREF